MHALGGFTHHRKGFWQQIVQGLALGQTVFEIPGFWPRKRLVGELFKLRL